MRMRFFAWLLVICWMFVIFNFSSKEANVSSKQSGKVVSVIVKNTVNVAKKTEDSISNKQNKLNNEEFLYYFHLFVRKLAHITEYFVLALLIFLALYTEGYSLDKIFILAIFVCFLYAISDEIHQTFIQGRVGSFFDCLIDTFGVFVACASTKLFLWIKYKKTT